MIVRRIFNFILFIGILCYFLKISFFPSTSFIKILEVIVITIFIKYLYQFTLTILKKSLIKSSSLSSPISITTTSATATSTTTNHQRIYFCKIYHAGFFPVRHIFEFSLLYFGIDLDLLEKNKDSGENLEALLNINDNDYLGQINLQDNDSNKENITSIKEKLLWHIEKHDISTKELKRIELVTIPKILNYAFNSANFYFCYDKFNYLSIIVLEEVVNNNNNNNNNNNDDDDDNNNTFGGGEKYLYILNRDKSVDNNASKLGYDMSFTLKRAFYISTPASNDRKEIYGAYCKDPASGYFDIKLVKYTDITQEDNNNNNNKEGENDNNNFDDNKSKPISKYIKKSIIISQGNSYVLNYYSIIYAILTYPLDIFLIMPRILKETFKLHYSKKFGIYHEPISIEGTVVKLEPNYLELYAQEVIIKYFTNLISQINESLYITINFSNFNQSTIKLQSNPNEIFSPFFHNSKHIILNLHDYSFFTNLLINQNIYRALIVGYFEKAWDCNNLLLLFWFLFNTKNIGNNGNNSNNGNNNNKNRDINTIHRDNKIKLNAHELITAMIRRRYWSKILKDEESGLKAKLEFDKILHQNWPSKGVDENFISSVMQNDVCYDLRIDGEIKSHEKVAIAIRELLAKNEEDNKIVALFGYTHLYSFTIPSNNSIRHLSPLISDKLHLFPFPSRYLPYENKEPIEHPIDKFIFSNKKSLKTKISSSSSINNNYNIVTNIWEKLKHIWMIFSMTTAYQVDSKFWQMTTGFVNGPNGNPFLEEKLLWEGIIDILKNRNMYLEDNQRGFNINNRFNYNNNNNNNKNNNNDKLNLFEGWEVVYERIAEKEHLQLATIEPSIPKLPIVFTSRRNSNIESDKQQRLWYFMKCYRKAILFRNDFD
ncbi:hypothetical protein Glove_146g56 [Diversispora epigaea]|uniref:Uncharacterized protein n=1 Tax=Diversispora epigaea TaxID=1348612 RepID=A0A397J2E9_9GLOM|nr:hypothetical protein Glove_146g56 [Diversispora epigaea]